MMWGQFWILICFLLALAIDLNHRIAGLSKQLEGLAYQLHVLIEKSHPPSGWDDD